jgi:hypothetical protein
MKVPFIAIIVLPLDYVCELGCRHDGRVRTVPVALVVHIVVEGVLPLQCEVVSRRGDQVWWSWAKACKQSHVQHKDSCMEGKGTFLKSYTEYRSHVSVSVSSACTAHTAEEGRAEQGKGRGDDK